MLASFMSGTRGLLRSCGALALAVVLAACAKPAIVEFQLGDPVRRPAPSPIEDYRGAVEAIAAVISRDLGIPLPHRVSLYLYPTPWAFGHGLEADGGLSSAGAAAMSGYATAVTTPGRVLVNTADLTDMSWPKRVEILAHELTHIAQRHLAGGRSMQWLREGFAEWVTAEVVARLGLETRDVRFAKARGRVRWVKDAGDLPELKHLVTAGEWNLVQAKPAGAASYDLALLATALLIRDAGLPALVEYFRLAGEPVGATGPFHQAFGVSLKEFEARCDAYLQEILR